ncbi:ArsC family transcriptional regulator [Aurantiacibacter atlanticus]|uniref:ArsC family transcriptional regulator n=1 Tax=Aurantiacibacter atlanticus TaxID=1648404 RepID=A0A0H4VV17_9SPHN|nr:ArsC family reductase [Aurantiacibacter atlanticus]AKQ40898.1 ArsC family transcriptional regulator [Aurantiacibacter atlanticus]MDF1835365.1 ArsC family reductase [Alteraurantiacibacter sp. bin_em_oilr2.035]
MANIEIYGIPNCDTVKKARKWLDAQGVEYIFHDYKKEGVDADNLARWADRCGWEVLLNRRGTTFRKLDDAQKADITRDRALALMVEYPSMIKRPVAETQDGDRIVVGFNASEWENTIL